ncbi:hypothetical protein TWF694_000192 [Orbilia ellipsospora]|uniref:Ankyrin n=1 Tax=Orbilia ellipsospora TaxID=2528407 RepID=A0AAV9XMV5_9PEZI
MPPTITKLIWDGNFTKGDLDGVDEAKINEPDPSNSGLTPLCAAVWTGNVEAVKLLIKNKADVKRRGSTRSPLWIAASKTEKNVGQIIQLLIGKGADPTVASEDDYNSTPLLNAVVRKCHPDILSYLVDAGASPSATDSTGQSAQSIAEKEKHRKVLNALLPKGRRTKDRSNSVYLVVAVMLFVVAWVNKNAKAAFASIILAAFQFSGIFDRIIPKKVAETTTLEDFRAEMKDFVKDSNLREFFPEKDPFIDSVINKAAMLGRNPENSTDPKDLAKLALYQPVIYCDDSGSMREGTRREDLRSLVKRVAEVTTKIVPDNEGVEIRFINLPTAPHFSKPKLNAIDAIMAEAKYDGWTAIGTNLKEKVLEPLIYAKLRQEKAVLTRPVLICIITDGSPEDPVVNEKRETLQNNIIECGDILEKHGYHRDGDAEEAEEFLDELRNAKLDGVLYCTTERLDDKYEGLRENECQLEQWLMSPIMPA